MAEKSSKLVVHWLSSAPGIEDRRSLAVIARKRGTAGPVIANGALDR